MILFKVIGISIKPLFEGWKLSWFTLHEHEVTGFNGNAVFMPALTGHDILTYLKCSI